MLLPLMNNDPLKHWTTHKYNTSSLLMIWWMFITSHRNFSFGMFNHVSGIVNSLMILDKSLCKIWFSVKPEIQLGFSGSAIRLMSNGSLVSSFLSLRLQIAIDLSPPAVTSIYFSHFIILQCSTRARWASQTSTTYTQINKYQDQDQMKKIRVNLWLVLYI